MKPYNISSRQPTPKHHVRSRRLCLFCRKMFDSSWAGERFCRRCRTDSDEFKTRQTWVVEFL